MALLPPGPYIFDVVALHEKKISLAGHHLFIFRLRLVGTTFELHWIVGQPAYWTWREFVDDFHYLAPAVVGRRLLFEVRRIPHRPGRGASEDINFLVGPEAVNFLVGPLAEVIDYV